MKKIILFILFFITQIPMAYSADFSNLSLGLGYPYISAKYNFSEKSAAEFRYAAGSGINVYAGRFYWNFKAMPGAVSKDYVHQTAKAVLGAVSKDYVHQTAKKYNRTRLFTGFEGGYVNFNTLDIKGTGYETSLFLGSEHFITKRMSLIVDFAPTLIGLKSDNYKVSGLEWVLNFGLYFHFSGDKVHDNSLRGENIIQNINIEKPLKRNNEKNLDLGTDKPMEYPENLKDIMPDNIIQKSKPTEKTGNDGLLNIELPE